MRRKSLFFAIYGKFTAIALTVIFILVRVSSFTSRPTDTFIISVALTDLYVLLTCC